MTRHPRPSARPGFSRRETIAAALVATGSLAPISGALAAAARAGPVDLAAYRGKVLYLDFWASWCAPCQLSFPFMSQVAARYAGRNFRLLAVNVDHVRQKADAFLAKAGGSVPVAFDPDGVLAARFGVHEMPTSFLLGPDGAVRFVHKGFFPDQAGLYVAHIEEMLNAH
ncbi:MAG: TlpA family protein disulfide reductase [Proteobacteria bacterium]|nr:TlpA family protein disulfide reductase [Pseudomonadota bacterium]